MNSNLRKALASLVIIVVLFGWYVTIFGIGSLSSIKDAMKFGLDINGGVYVVMEADTNKSGAELKQLMEQTREVMNNRVNQMGISEATVSLEGTNRLRIEMPGVKDAQEAIDKIGQTAKLKFELADGTEVLTGKDVKTATIDTDSENGGYKINLTFTANGAKKFADATTKASSGQVTSTISGASNNSIVIMLDDDMVTAPTVAQTIDSTDCEITSNGGFSKEEASTTAALIRGGALPVSLHEVTSSVQTATIGVNALNKSVVAGFIGLLLIFALMIFMYSILGLFADIALLLYVLIVLWSMAGLGAVLSLPGIAGIIVGIGMAVDANVIIFARIKDEICAGKSIRVAVDQGFKHALVTVLDSQITTLIATVVLYEVGSTTVRGFALTLMISIIVSIFTAVVITQIFVGLAANSEKLAKNKYFGVHEDGTPKLFVKKQFKFIESRKIFYTISAVVIIAGIATAGIRGFNYGIDFTGGTMIQLDMGKTVSVTEVQKTISKYDLNPSIVLAGNNKDQIIIKTTKFLNADARAKVIDTIGAKYGTTSDDILASETFGPTIGKELRNNAVKAVLIAALGMLIYIIFRFKSWKYGVSSIAGILHDVLVVLSFYAIFRITVNNPLIAAVLTVVGYSINDTIVIFDRIRENRHLIRKEPLINILDLSINQTLNRSIMTSLTTLVSMVPLYIMVSSSIREFVLPLMVGIITGTYSSICLCSPLLYQFARNEDDKSKYLTAQQTKTAKKKAEPKQIAAGEAAAEADETVAEELKHNDLNAQKASNANAGGSKKSKSGQGKKKSGGKKKKK